MVMIFAKKAGPESLDAQFLRTNPALVEARKKLGVSLTLAEVRRIEDFALLLRANRYRLNELRQQYNSKE